MSPHLKLYKGLILGLSAMLVFGFAGNSIADWQTALDSRFDIVSTFDDIQDWRGKYQNAVSITDYPDEFPLKIDGSPSIWKYYYLPSYSESGNSDWIGNHGSGNIWRGTGKSMRIDYGLGADGQIYGPSRFACKIGDSPDDGYKDVVHVFFMTKWFKDFFKTNGDEFEYHRFLKTLDVSAGFKNVRQFGTDSENQWLKEHGAKTQVLNEYGMNAQVYNYQTYGGDKTAKITYLVTNSSDYISYSSKEGNTEATIFDFIMNNEWFGIEYRIKTSNPHGAANGEFEIWIYDPNTGNVVSHDLWTGVVNFKDGITNFNHGWNKFVWGGNRYAGAYCPEGDPLCDFGPIDHFYIDDVIIHGSQIGPTYFKILDDPNYASPTPPSGLRIISSN